MWGPLVQDMASTAKGAHTSVTRCSETVSTTAQNMNTICSLLCTLCWSGNTVKFYHVVKIYCSAFGVSEKKKKTTSHSSRTRTDRLHLNEGGGCPAFLPIFHWFFFQGLFFLTASIAFLIVALPVVVVG